LCSVTIKAWNDALVRIDLYVYSLLVYASCFSVLVTQAVL
jgi:hypothetical protein